MLINSQRNAAPRAMNHGPRGDSRPRLSSRAQLDRAGSRNREASLRWRAEGGFPHVVWYDCPMLTSTG